MNNPFPNGVVQPTGGTLGLSTFLGQGISITDQHYLYPKVTTYSLQLEHQFPSRVLASVAYHGAYTSGLGVTKNVNALPACYYAGGGCTGAGITSLLNAQVANPMSGYLPSSSGLNAKNLPQQDFYLPYPEFGAINVTYTSLNGNQRAGVVNYNAMFAQLTKRVTHGLEFDASFTLAKVMDQLAFTNPTDLNPGKYEDTQPTRFFGINLVYDLPKANTANAFVRSTLNGWKFSASENWQQNTAVGNPSGAFSTGVIPTAKNRSLSHFFNNCYIPIITQATTTTGVVYGEPMHDGQPGCQNGEQPAWIQQPSFTLNQINPSATMRDVRLPSQAYFNAGLAREFPIHERLSFVFRVDAFNPFNHPILVGGVQTGLTSATFG